MEEDYFTWQEIQSQPQAWQAGLDQLASWQGDLFEFYRLGGYKSLIFTGCGSSYYLSCYAAALMPRLVGLPARAQPSSELWLDPFPGEFDPGKTLLLAFSRSGETSETLNACQNFLEARRGDLVTLSCEPNAPLAGLGALNLVFPDSREQSFAQTRSLSTLYLAATWLAVLWGGRPDLLAQIRRMPALAARLLAAHSRPAATLAADLGLDRFYFLGSGPRYGLACELSLKMKEMSLSHSEAFHFLEFRHGPMAMADPSALIIGLVSEANDHQEMRVLDEMRQFGAQVLSLGECQTQMVFESGVDELLRGPLYLPAGQILAFKRAMHLGLNPDRPEKLHPYIRLDHTAGER